VGNIRIEWVPIQVFNLGWFGLNHLQLVHQQSDFGPHIDQEDWYVIEGIRDDTAPRLTLYIEGTNGRTTLSAANGGATAGDLVDAIGTPTQRGSHIIDVPNAAGTWDSIAAYARDFVRQDLPYIAYKLPGAAMPTLNSSSVISSLLYYQGIDITNHWPYGFRFSPGYSTLIGTSIGDEMTITGPFDTIVAGMGEDTLHGSAKDDKLYGGIGKDTIEWSKGDDVIHGGQPFLLYAQDGYDIVDFRGVRWVEIEGNAKAVQHVTWNFRATFEGGSCELYSIEGLLSDDMSDFVILKDDVVMGPPRLAFDFGGEDSGQGDTFSLANFADDLLVNAATDDQIVVTRQVQSSDGGGTWLTSLEWLDTGSGNDIIYANSELRGVVSGEGNDLVDARLTTAFADTSPQGYDIEIDTGDGNDTIVSGTGHTFANGGVGADTFILSSLSSEAGRVEFVIDDAGADDHLLVPYAFFDGSGGGYDGSPLMPVLGAIGRFADMVGQGWTLYFDSRTEHDYAYGTDYSQGIIRFIGSISFEMQGSDLLIHFYGGETQQDTIMLDDAGHTLTITDMYSLLDTEAVVRVVDFQEGDLGIQFYDPGPSSDWFLTDTPFGAISAMSYANWDAAVHALTSDGQFLSPLDARPNVEMSSPDTQVAQAPVDGTSGDDQITLAAPSIVDAGEGDDNITGSGGSDILDGGTGDDTLAGGTGNDVYIVDAVGDTVVELADEGLDQVQASLNWALTANVEDLQLTGSALSGEGNELDNQILGNTLDNTLLGHAGDDTLYGDAGNDTLNGGTGSDTYVYEAGGGDDVVVDTGSVADLDRLQLVGTEPSSVTITRLASAPNDMLLTFTEGGSIVVRNQGDPASGVDSIVFMNGTTVWSRAELDARFASAPIVDNLSPQAVDDGNIVVASGQAVVVAASLLGNDRDLDGDTIAIVAVENVSIGSASVTAGGDIALNLPEGFAGEFSFDYTVSDGHGGTATAHAVLTSLDNHAPQVATPPPAYTVNAAAPFTITLPEGLFTDPDGDPLWITATLPGFQPLPSWLTFDASLMQLSGTPPPGALATLELVVHATDGISEVDATISLTLQSSGGQTITGTSANDTLNGSSGDDTFKTIGDAGFDTIAGGAGYDTILGSAYNDVIRVSGNNVTGIEAIDGGAGADTIKGTSGDDVMNLSAIALTAIENIDGASGNDVILGTSGNDVITGGTGNDTLAGGDGNDTFSVVGDGDLDQIDGGAGYDTILGSAYNDVIRVSGNNLTGIEAIDGGAGADTIKGTSGDDVMDLSAIALTAIENIDGASGNDVILGSSGNDVITGGTGNDTLAGGDGNDTFSVVGDGDLDQIDGGAGYDVVLGSGYNDVIRVASGLLNLVGIETIDGGAGTGDRILATAGDDNIDLSTLVITGIERIDLGLGNDHVIGSSGADTFLGGGGADTFVLRPAGGRDVVSDFQATGPGHDVIEIGTSLFADWTALEAAITDSANGAVITIDDANSLTLTGVTRATLIANHATDFLFVA
jgi:Ca2+-binding RTX toxin-like protein